MLQEQSVIENKKPKGGAVVNVATKLNPDNPIPLDYGSNFYTVISGQRYLPFGQDDNYPNVCWELRNQSITHDACVSSIALSCVGGGIQVMNKKPEDVDKDFLAFISNINTDGESLTDLARTAIECRETDGNAWAELVKGTFAGKPYLKAYVHSSLVCRLGGLPKDKDKPVDVIKSTKFAEKRTRILSSRSLKAVTIPLYDANPLMQNIVWKKNESGEFSSIIHLKNADKSSLFYGVQRSKSGLTYQYAEYKLIRYNTDCLDNQMVQSAAIIFKSPMTQEEASAAAKEILRTHTGNGKNGRVAVIASESGIENFEIIPLETQKEGSYIELDKRIVEKITTASNWDSVFFGMGDQGTLGKGSGYIRGVWDVKKATVIDPINSYVISHFVKPLIDIAADHMNKPDWKTYELGFITAMPFSYSSDIDVNAVLFKNEGRELLSYPKAENEEWDKEPIKGGTKPKEDVPPEPAK